MTRTLLPRPRRAGAGFRAVAALLLAFLALPAEAATVSRKYQLEKNRPDVASDGEGACPYCGTTNRLKAGEKVHVGH